MTEAASIPGEKCIPGEKMACVLALLEHVRTCVLILGLNRSPKV
jgi:hypothetical protein